VRRREFIALLGGAATAWPLAARAQQPGKLPTIGFVGAGTPSTYAPWVATFVKRLRELGWVEGRTIAIEIRWAEGRGLRYAEIAAEVVRMKVDVLVTSATPARMSWESPRTAATLFVSLMELLPPGERARHNHVPRGDGAPGRGHRTPCQNERTIGQRANLSRPFVHWTHAHDASPDNRGVVGIR